MDWGGWLLFGSVATVVLTGIMVSANLLGITRMGMPLILGTMITSDVDRARIYGTVMHAAAGLVFALAYAWGFSLLDRATWWLGALFGLIHGLSVLTILVPLMPGMHPRMASDRAGPDLHLGLEPPGFLGLNYGVPTPVVTLVAHVAFGIILGSFIVPR